VEEGVNDHQETVCTYSLPTSSNGQDEMITASTLGRLLFEEFDRDNWGMIDPYLFNPAPEDHQTADSIAAYDVLERVAARINTGDTDREE